MIIITGPQGNDEEVGLIAEVAGLYDGVPAYIAVLQWATATALYCLVGWERCPAAVADVQIAQTAGMVIRHLSI